MLSFSRNKKQKIISFLLLIIFSVLFISFIANYNEGAASGAAAQDIPLSSRESLNQIDMIVLSDGKTKNVVDNSPNIIKILRGQVQYYDAGLFWLQALSFSGLIIYAKVCCRKRNKPLPIIALPLGGHAPPNSLV